jgi:hypothetical protein
VQRFTAALVTRRASQWVQWAGANGLISPAATNSVSQGFVEISPSQGCD